MSSSLWRRQFVLNFLKQAPLFLPSSTFETVYSFLSNPYYTRISRAHSDPFELDTTSP